MALSAQALKHVSRLVVQFGSVKSQSKCPVLGYWDAEGTTFAYVSVDLTGVGQQGPDGAAAEGRMAAVGMIDNPVPEDRRQWASPPPPGWPTFDSGQAKIPVTTSPWTSVSRMSRPPKR